MSYSLRERGLRLHRLPLVALAALLFAAMPARAAFHLWALNEIYTNSSGTLQFIELNDSFGSQNFIGGQQISVTDASASTTHTFTIPAASNLGGSTLNHSLLFGTAGLQAAGGPAPDFIIPNGFLFSAGGSINFFGLNSGPYAALPTDGIHSRLWNGGDAVNNATNYAGQSGSVPAPGVLAVVAGGGLVLCRRRRAG
jgi:serralysin